MGVGLNEESMYKKRSPESKADSPSDNSTSSGRFSTTQGNVRDIFSARSRRGDKGLGSSKDTPTVGFGSGGKFKKVVNQ